MAANEARRREGNLRDASVPRKLQEHGREAYQHAQALGSNLEEAVDEIGGFLRENLEQRPYLTLATAAGVGYVLGGGLPLKLTAMALGLGTRFAIEMFVRELTGQGKAGERAGSGPDGSDAQTDAVQRSFS
jgi:ElaB/YqjD/DUF883 family membrane-anchored ribosome-binding protein